MLMLIGGMAAARLERSLAEPRIRVLPDLEALRVILREQLGDRTAVAAD